MYKYWLFLFAFFLPFSTSALTVYGVIDRGIDFFKDLIVFFVLLAVLFFLWGMVKFIAHADDEKAVEEGKQIMIWGLVGLFVVVSFWGIIAYIQDSLGVNTFGTVQQGPSVPTKIP